MTKFWQERYDEMIENFINFLSQNNMTQATAAELLDISRGQLSHLLKKERSLNDFIFDRMKYIIAGKEPQRTGGIYGLYYNNEIIYIGQTNNFNHRFSSHKNAIKSFKNDGQPFHQSQIDKNLLIQKILYSCENKFLYPQELSRLEELLIRTILPEWNTNIRTLSSYKTTQEDKVLQLITYHKTHLQLLQHEIMSYNFPITEECNYLLTLANSYSLNDILNKAIKLISNNKPRVENESELTTVVQLKIKELREQVYNQYFEEYGEYPKIDTK